MSRAFALWLDAANRLLLETERQPEPQEVIPLGMTKCPNCGRLLARRGAHLHTRRCEGKS